MENESLRKILDILRENASNQKELVKAVAEIEANQRLLQAEQRNVASQLSRVVDIVEGNHNQDGLRIEVTQLKSRMEALEIRVSALEAARGKDSDSESNRYKEYLAWFGAVAAFLIGSLFALPGFIKGMLELFEKK